ncbi:macro domain-containing protein [Cesiribacter sp. SM1]|uniref:macro domain-containing protein n=1 Tax=Cesiribacter sp. SM1 TaxID=2861196 RepID=UPI001CD37C21|nr:macro domain-containing protein [Cesiribacter sp. SM1]
MPQEHSAIDNAGSYFCVLSAKAGEGHLLYSTDVGLNCMKSKQTSKKIILVHKNSPELGQAWMNDFAFHSDVSVVDGDIFEQQCDAIVSPGNSFGFMDGGLDLIISKKLGWDIQKQLQAKIKSLPLGELLVGQALTISTANEPKYVICAPTMRVPTSYNISTSINAYLAMKAILLELANHNEIETVAIPGLCTGTGNMEPAIASKQMFAAYEEIILGTEREFPTFMDAQKFHFRLNPKKIIN